MVPALLATGVFLVLAGTEAGFYPTSWYAGALFLVGLLAASFVALGPPRGLPRPTLVALALFAAFAAWSFLSIIWASQPGVAWDGANRTVAYLVVFALFGLWPFDSRGVMAVLGLLGFGIAGIGLVELLKANSSAEPLTYFIDVRFAEPAGYMNANVALWTLGLLPCVFLASRRSVPVLLRGLALGGAGVLTGLALMGQSRGWVLALPLALAFFLIVCPGRVRLLAAVVAVAVAGLAIRAPALAVHDEFEPERIDALLADATGAILIAAAALTLAGLLAGLVDRRVEPGPVANRRIGWATAALVAVVLVGGVVGYAATEGSPSGRIADAWDDFKGGGLGPQAGGSRFAGGGTNRYDFWTVAWAAFKDNPVQGLGSENFQEEYLENGVSGEQPRFPHSLELGVLSQTGLPGALLLLGAFGFAAAAAIRDAGGATTGPRCGGRVRGSLRVLVRPRFRGLVLGVLCPDGARAGGARDGRRPGAAHHRGALASRTRAAGGRRRRDAPGGRQLRPAVARRAGGRPRGVQLGGRPRRRPAPARPGREPQPIVCARPAHRRHDRASSRPAGRGRTGVQGGPREGAPQRLSAALSRGDRGRA